MIKNKILIVAADHNETDMQFTIDTAISNAKFPDMVSIGICSTNRQNDLKAKDIENIKIQYHSAMGVTLPKFIPIVYNDNSHEYTLVIDAHTIFAKNWDQILLNYHKEIEKNNNLFLISPGLPMWNKDNLDIVLKEVKENKVSHSFEMYMSLEKNYKGHYILTSLSKPVYWENYSSGYKESSTISGNFMFGKKEIFQEFVMDPFLVWGGDQEAMALRLSTRGYKFFTIKDGCALTKQKDEDYRYQNKDDWRNYTENKVFKYIFKNSSIRMKDIFTGDILGYWGAPSKEKLDEFSQRLGLDFSKMYAPERNML
jgi:hypothetical protein